nr:hypothetical protein CFP56_09337 [Quercus suber]
MPLIERNDLRKACVRMRKCSNSKVKRWHFAMILGGTSAVLGKFAKRNNIDKASSKSLNASTNVGIADFVTTKRLRYFLRKRFLISELVEKRLMKEVLDVFGIVEGRAWGR